MFKAGDTVKVVDISENYIPDGPNILGFVGVVQDEESSFIRVKFKEEELEPNPTWPTGAYPFFPEELEHV
jgi:hypothetical protein